MENKSFGNMTTSKFNLMFDSLWKCIDNKQNVDEILGTFTTDHTNQDWFILAFRNLQTFKMLPFDNGDKELILKTGKSLKKSEEWRLTANKTLQHGKDKYGEALFQYTKSIAYAPYPTGSNSNAPELALALGNRSLVLLMMNEIDACLKDAEKALDYDYPKHMAFKLYFRQGKCFKLLGNMATANRRFQKSLSMLKSSKLTVQEMASMESKIKMEQGEIPIMKHPNVQKKEAVPPSITYKPHKTLACASQCVDLKFGSEMGRSIEAIRDIKPGDVLIVESPYASVLLPEFYHTHCFHCLQRFFSLIPCKSCSQAMYCSTVCRDVSWKDYHRHECPVLEQLLDLDMGLDWMLALRTVLVAAAKNGGIRRLFNNIAPIEQVDSTTAIADSVNQLMINDADPFHTIHNLNQNRDNRSFKNAYKLATIATCVANCLDKFTDLLTVKDDPTAPDLELFNFVGGLLLRLIQSLMCNNFMVADLVSRSGGDLTVERFGAAVYATASFLNHSCDPNVIRSNHCGAGLSIMATRHIKEGEQVFCDYGFQYNQNSLEERQFYLQTDYFFSCKCDACTEDWPLYAILETVDPMFLCSMCQSPLLDSQDTAVLHVVCTQCNHKQNMALLRKKLEDVTSTYARIKNLLLSGLLQQGSTQELACLLSMLNKIVERPNKVMLDTVDALRHSVMQAGNYYTD